MIVLKWNSISIFLFQFKEVLWVKLDVINSIPALMLFWKGVYKLIHNFSDPILRNHKIFDPSQRPWRYSKNFFHFYQAGLVKVFVIHFQLNLILVNLVCLPGLYQLRGQSYKITFVFKITELVLNSLIMTSIWVIVKTTT